MALSTLWPYYNMHNVMMNDDDYIPGTEIVTIKVVIA
jgi:hypothetical protein